MVFRKNKIHNLMYNFYQNYFIKIVQVYETPAQYIDVIFIYNKGANNLNTLLLTAVSTVEFF